MEESRTSFFSCCRPPPKSTSDSRRTHPAAASEVASAPPTAPPTSLPPQHSEPVPSTISHSSSPPSTAIANMTVDDSTAAAQEVSTFAAVPALPLDPIFALAAECKADPDPNKINLSIGAYRDNSGKPWVLPVVKKAEHQIVNDSSLDHEYLPIDGLRSFTDASARLILGADSPVIRQKRYAAVQTISGTGAVRLGADFLARAMPKGTVALISDPTWGNHFAIFGDAGFQVQKYRYWDAEKRRLAFDDFLNTLRSAPDRSVVLMHACAHNPTGVDPTREQWKQIAAIIRQKRHFPFFDCAYQGFASGSLDDDAWAVRYFAEELGFELFVAQSYSKNFGLYGERTGCLTIVLKDASLEAAIRSQLCRLNRASISNPPSFGARIVSLVLNDKALYKEWTDSLTEMSQRIIKMRHAVLRRLQQLQTPGDWTHITSQIGMFSYTGLSVAQCIELKKRFHVYLSENGRISMAGLNDGNVERFADGLDWVVRNVKA
ncbi:Aspartate aminotransferase, cytoplasmic [Phlyctochytrium bullatum]|nr:Aspartate aminotransferase, cytoplasmic [Phlyctochytrium bullatum]